MIDWDSCVLWLDSKHFSESYWWDRSKYDGDGKVYGAVWKEDGLYFDGNSRYVRIKFKSIYNFDYNPFSVEVIIESDYKGNYQGIVFHYHGKGYIVSTEKNTGKARLTCGTITVKGNTDVCDGELHHIVTVRGAAPNKYVKIYVDKELDNIPTSNSGRATPNSVIDVGIGMYIEPYFGNYPFHGKIKLVRMYNKELTEDEIKVLARMEGF